MKLPRVKRFAPVTLAAVLTFGLTGCVKDRADDPNLLPRHISVSVKSVELMRGEGEEVLHTKVVFAWRGIFSAPVYINGDQTNSISVGVEFSEVELVDWARDAAVYRLRYKPTNRSYMLRFLEDTKEQK